MLELDLALTIVFGISIVVQVYYMAVYFRHLITYDEQKLNKGQIHPLSIVVAARNEADNLPALLDGLLNQNYVDYEVIVINDRSNDGSHEILEKYVHKNSRLKVVTIKELPDDWNGKKYALSQGIRASQNDIMVLTDADCIPRNEKWLSSINAQFDQGVQFVIGFSPYQEKRGFLNHLIRFETLWTGIQYLSFALAGIPYMAVGRNLAYSKAIFSRNGFDEIRGITGGDDDLLVNRSANAANTRIVMHQDSQTVSKPKTTWSSYFKQKIRHLSVGKRYHKKDRTRLGLFALCSLFGWILLFYLLFTSYYSIWILTLFAVRSILFYIIFTRAGRKLGVSISPISLPFLDLFYNIFYLVIGLRALTAKRITWS